MTSSRKKPCTAGLLTILGAASALAFASNPAAAMSFELGEELTLDVDVTTSYGAAWRAKDANSKILADFNADDGNRNFKKGDMVSNRFSVIADINARYGDYGIFLRPRAFYDFAYDGRNANDSGVSNNNGPLNGGPLSATDQFENSTLTGYRDDIELLDAFVYGSFDVGENNLDLRLGRQVVSWGESLFIPNGISAAQSPLDATQAFAPGVELRDIYLPVNQLFAELNFGGQFSVAGYYQFEWDPTRTPEAGSFYASIDWLDDAGNRVLVPVIPDLGIVPTVDRVRDRDAKDSGQYGIAFRYLAESLNNTEFGLYHINYHNKAPNIESAYSGGSPSLLASALGGTYGNLPVAPGFTLGMVDPVTAATLDIIDNSSYWLEYAEDIKLYGLSFGTVIADTNIGGEISYRTDLPIPVSDPLKPLTLSYERAEYVQAQISMTQIFPATKLYDQLSVAGEAAWGKVIGVDQEKLDPLTYDKTAWGFTARISPNYFSVLPGVDMSVPLTLSMNIDGNSPLATFSEKSDSVALGFDFTYLQNMTAGFSYTAYINGPDTDNLSRNISDRDFYAFNLKYTF